MKKKQQKRKIPQRVAKLLTQRRAIRVFLEQKLRDSGRPVTGSMVQSIILDMRFLGISFADWWRRYGEKFLRRPVRARAALEMLKLSSAFTADRDKLVKLALKHGKGIGLTESEVEATLDMPVFDVLRSKE